MHQPLPLDFLNFRLSPVRWLSVFGSYLWTSRLSFWAKITSVGRNKKSPLVFSGQLSLIESPSEVNKFFYFILNIGFIFLSVYLRRKVFLIIGTIGVLNYLGHLAWQVLKDSYGLPIVLALAGLGVVFLGVKYQRNRKRFEAAIEKSLPKFLLKWRPIERA